ncbi:ABC transporter permease [Bacillus thermotolerans]|uniref:ABC transporter, permease protein (Putative) n=1 Tax=Bacillus thermotolerans TaxID=1221996 RepID=A0A0F5I4H7_BACTR|nr:ABC transporter permease [Bacillus thermotolerans]KKB40436.1 putative ABC transporter, permease protein (putative) [Bacillus thermotolerans]
MNNFWLILSQSYTTKFKTKSFLVTTVLVALAILVATNMERIFSYFDEGGETEQIAVVDESGTLFEPFQAQFSAVEDEVKLVKTNESESVLKDEVEEGTYEGYLMLRETEGGLPAGVYKAGNITSSGSAEQIQQALQSLKTIHAAESLQLTDEQMKIWNAPVQFNTVALADTAKSEEERMQAQSLVYVLLFFIYLSVIMYANMIASDVAIEKSSRVMEILISSVSPVTHMFAKILGVGLLGLTQLGIWLLVAYLSLANQPESLAANWLGFSSLSSSMMIYAVIFFVLGYFLYATVAALLGSLVSRLEDVQQMMTPLTLLVMAGFFISMYGLVQPESTFITVTSYIPFFTPMTMFVRIGMLNIPLWEILLGVGVLLVSIFLLGSIGARIYKGGVLMYGKSNSLKDMKKALDLSKNR